MGYNKVTSSWVNGNLVFSQKYAGAGGNVQFNGVPLLGTNIIGGGKTYFVDYIEGLDSNEGTDPNYAKKTIAGAFLSVVGYATNSTYGVQNDYIFIINSKDQDAAATITPVSPAEAHWHLIGISNPQATFGVVLRVTGEVISCITLNNGCGLESEIAGINFGGGATSQGGISLSQIHGLWVHDCTFGASFCGDTPAYGICKPDQTNNENCLIENNWFYGNANNSQGKLTTDGICMLGPTPAKNLIIRNNVFLGISGVAINIDSLGGIITNNRISLDADTAGAAITLGSYSLGCYIDDNHCTFGESGTDTAGFLDNAASNANNWGLNYVSKAVAMPS